MDYSSAAGRNKIKKVIDQTESYEKDMFCFCSRFEAKRSRINSDNKDEISERYLGIARESKPFVQAVVQMKQHLVTLENLQTAAPELDKIRSIIHYIPLKFSAVNVTAQDFAICENQLLALERHLKELRKLNHISQYVEQISKELPIFAKAIVEMKKAHRTRAFVTTLDQPNSLLTQIANERKQLLAAGGEISDELNAKLATLKLQMRNSFNDTYYRGLLSTLNTIENAIVAEQVDRASREFSALASRASVEAKDITDAQKQSYETSCRSVEKAIVDSRQLDPNIGAEARLGIRVSVVEAQEHLLALETWEQEHVKEIPYINVPMFDMKWLQDVATGRVYSRVRERLDGLMKLMRREETYRYGLLNHLLLIPYVQATRAANGKR